MAIGLVWKRVGESSSRCLKRISREMLWPRPGGGRSGVGHTGTLDPFAEGLLLVGQGEGTKLLAYLQGFPKIYEASFVFEATSQSFDPETEICLHSNLRIENNFFDRFSNFLKTQIGFFYQRPPNFSAVKLGGKPAYKLARQGHDLVLKEREIEIFEAKLISENIINSGVLNGKYHFRVELKVSAGTYIRALARDWGLSLFGRPGMLFSLTRKGIGPFFQEKPFESFHPLNFQDFEFFWKKEEMESLTQRELSDFRNQGLLWERVKKLGCATMIFDASRAVALCLSPSSGRVTRIFHQDPFL